MHIPLFGTALRRRPISRVVETPRPEGTGIAGTIALYTDHGPIPAHLLSPGDRVIRRGQGPVALRALHLESFSGPMVRFAPDALGRARPEDFLFLPPEQRLLLRRAAGAPRDGLFAARALVDGDTITWATPPEPLQIVHLSFDQSEVVHAGGLELEIG